MCPVGRSMAVRGTVLMKEVSQIDGSLSPVPNDLLTGICTSPPLLLPTLTRRCVYQKEDEKGVVGVHLSKELMRIAGHALKVGEGGGVVGWGDGLLHASWRTSREA